MARKGPAAIGGAACRTPLCVLQALHLTMPSTGVRFPLQVDAPVQPASQNRRPGNTVTACRLRNPRVPARHPSGNSSIWIQSSVRRRGDILTCIDPAQPERSVSCPGRSLHRLHQTADCWLTTSIEAVQQSQLLLCILREIGIPGQLPEATRWRRHDMQDPGPGHRAVC